MNKITKIGVSALCGSLASVVAANAGSLDVTGGATATYTQLSYGETGNPLGMDTGLTFKGSGEMDNGGTVTLTIGHTDQNGYDASSIAYAAPGLGTFTYDEGGGTGLDRIDDMMPTAWEEVNGTGVGMGLSTVAGAGGGSDIEWAVSEDMLPDGLSLHLAYSPKADGKKAKDKAGGGAASGGVDGAGYDIVLQHSGLMDGMNVFAGYSTISQGQDAQNHDGDRTQYTVGATYALGMVTVGYQWQQDNLNQLGAATSYYENEAFGLSFNVNDDLSISYGIHKSERHMSDASVTNELDAESFQLAYSMGGASIKIAETEVDNANYISTTAGDREGTTVALSLAF